MPSPTTAEPREKPLLMSSLLIIIASEHFTRYNYCDDMICVWISFNNMHAVY